MADTGDHAYSHALATLLDPARAVPVAVRAVRLGGRSVTLTLAHAHRGATEAAAADAPTAPAPDAVAPAELAALARALTATRPAAERAVADLAGRHGLDRARLARALGVNPDEASEQVAAVAARWQAELDPALLARLGPGSCAELAVVLAERGLWQAASADAASVDPDTPSLASAGGEGAGPAGSARAEERAGGRALGTERDLRSTVLGSAVPELTMGDLLAAAGPVGTHAASCAVCDDRLRAVVSVRDLVAGEPLHPAPAPVRAAGRLGWLRPPVFPDAAEGRTTRRRARLLSVTAVLIALLLIAALAVVLTGDGGDGASRVADLARVPSGGGVLKVRPRVLQTNPLPAVVLRNEGDRELSWRVETGVAWLTAAPSEGVLGAGRGVSVDLTIGADAPEGDVRTAVNVVADDGSTASVRIETTVEHPPDLDAQAAGCTVTAVVEDESQIASVALHYRDPLGREAREQPMVASGSGWRATLPAGDQPLTWWVTATDARGNATKGSESTLERGCPAVAAPLP